MDDWKKTLGNTFDDIERSKQQELEARSKALIEAEQFIKSVVLPAFNEVKAELEQRGQTVSVTGGSDGASFTVRENDRITYQYSIRVSIPTLHPYPEFRSRESGQMMRGVGTLRSGGQDFTIADVSKQEILMHLVADYTNHIQQRSKQM
jgi:hypothetical protein